MTQSPAADGPPPRQTMRIASYNTRDFLDDRAAAADVVRAVDPDVLCLQEVPRRLLGTTRLVRFATECGLYATGPHWGSGGTAVLTSLRVLVSAATHGRLAVARLARRRGYAAVRVGRPGHLPLTVVSVHLGLDPEERVRHAAEVLRGIPEGEPLVVAGDLNEPPGGPAWRPLDERLALASPPAPTFPARRPGACIDVVLVSPEVEVAPHAEVALDPAAVVAASDHWPVWADVRVGPLPPVARSSARPRGAPAAGR